MTSQFSPSDDLFTAGDRIELVTLLNEDDVVAAVGVPAFRSPISGADQQRFADTTDPRNVTFSLDAARLATPPQLHGTILDAKGMPFEILVAQLRTAATRWKCITRDITFCQCTPPEEELPDFLPIRTHWMHADAYIVNGSPLVVVNNPPSAWVTLAAQFPAANGDTFSFSFTVGEGQYKLHIYGIAESNSAKVDWRIDDQLVAAGQDWYSASTVDFVKKTVTGIVLGRGRHVLTGTINGKNALSSGYELQLTRYSLEPAMGDL